MSPEEFARAAVDHELYYHTVPAQTFHARIGKDIPFTMKLTFTEAREKGGFVLFRFAVERTVISGDRPLTFVFVRGAEA